MTNDIYPMQKVGKNPFNWKLFGVSIFLLTFAIVVLYLLTCNPKKPPVPPVVKPVAEQRETVKQDSLLSQKYKDSVNEVIGQLEDAAAKWYARYQSAIKSTDLAVNTVNTILNETVPDTCKAIQARLKAEFDKVVSNGKAKDNACNQTIVIKDGIIAAKNKLIANGKEDYRKLRANLDTAFAQQTKLEKYTKSIRPRSEIFIGASAIGNEIKPISGYGISLGLRNKKGTQFEIGALQFNNSIMYQIGIKKTLFKL